MPDAPTPPERIPASLVKADPAEAGQKLVTFLERRLPGFPRAALMRLVRTGQVRVNGGRRKPFDRVEAGDEVRIPPHTPPQASPQNSSGSHANPPAGAASAPALRLIFQDADILVLAKPAGLPVQPGTGHDDCVSARLRAMFPDAAYAPTPAHRLDRDTSGLLLAGRSYAGLSGLHALIRAHKLGKTYLAWVQGVWPHPAEIELRDALAKQGAPGRELVRTGEGQEAVSLVRPLRHRDNQTLLAIRLLTGRTHQIRVQLSSRQHAILGDRKYGGPACAAGLLLHAARLDLPERSFTLLPDWPAPWQVTEF